VTGWTRDSAIELDRLTMRYGRRRGIENVSLHVEPGEVFGFLGPNGAGKTTTIRTMLDLLRPTEGRAALLGLDSHRDAIEIHRRVGYLPGDFAAYPRMTGRRYLEFFATLRGLPPSSFESLAGRLGCDLKPRIASLSHGNVQKLGLIQALMHQPDLLVLDEPTQGLDPLVQWEFHDLVEETSARGGTVFLSSHVLPEVERTCDRIGIIDDGRLIVVEDVGDLRAKAIRVMEFHFAHPVPADAFADVPGTSDLEIHGDVMRCTVRGPMDALIKAVARYEVVDVQSRQPGLEELFLELYRGRSGSQG
jgi:ABC-2 type transport system ATP-binding protein